MSSAGEMLFTPVLINCLQVIPLHLPPGDPTPERTLQIDGTTDQIEHAKQLVNEIISGEVCFDCCVCYGLWQASALSILTYFVVIASFICHQFRII